MGSGGWEAGGRDRKWGAGSGGGAKSGAGSTFALSCGRVSKTVDVNPQSPWRATDILSATESFGNAPQNLNTSSPSDMVRLRQLSWQLDTDILWLKKEKEGRG